MDAKFANLQDSAWTMENCDVPVRPEGSFTVVYSDKQPRANSHLDRVLDTVYFLFQQGSFTKGFWPLMMSVQKVQVLLDFNQQSIADRAASLERLDAFVARGLPTVAVEMAGVVDDEGVEAYGLFDPGQPDVIHISGHLITQFSAAQNTPKLLKLAFMVLIKVIHELAHWIAFHNMKAGDSTIITPIELASESGLYIERKFVGHDVYHHSLMVDNKWDVDIVLFEDVPRRCFVGSHRGLYVDAAYMTTWFEVTTIMQREGPAQFQCASTNMHVIGSPRLAEVGGRVTTFDEFGTIETRGNVVGGLNPAGSFAGHCIRRTNF